MRNEFKKIYTLKQLSEMTDLHIRTIQRRYKAALAVNPDIENWKKNKKKPHKYTEDFLEYLMNPLGKKLLKKNNELSKENTQVSNHLRALKNKDLKLETFLDNSFEWDYFITIAPQENLSSEECYNLTSKVYETLHKLYPKKRIRMFFTTEKFSNRFGHHCHFLLRLAISDNVMQDLMNSMVKNSINDVVTYNPKFGGLHYISKEGLHGVSWDFFDSILESNEDIGNFSN